MNEKTISRWFLLWLIVYPVLIVAAVWRPTYGFLALPRFGELLYPHALEEVARYDPPRGNLYGYDGQFYLQMAIDPTLRDPRLKSAVDDLGYRGQRIGLPAIAYSIGFGNPRWVVQIYSVLNLVFWFALSGLLLRWVGRQTLEQRLTLVACLWTAGVLVSLSRALTDLPAVCLGLYSLHVANRSSHRNIGTVAAAMLALLSALCKETGVLSFPGCTAVDSRKRLIPAGLTIVAMAVPVACWQLYLRDTIGSAQGGYQNFDWPLVGLYDKVVATLAKSWREFPFVPIVELLGPLSIATQGIYLLCRWRWADPLWRFGVGFAALMLFLAIPVWETQSAYSRVLLPMTLAFNLLLLKDREQASRRSSNRWFVLGNIGLLDRAAPVLLPWLIFEWWSLRLARSRAELHQLTSG